MPLLDRILSVIAPHACLVCGDEGSLLCVWCRPDACSVVPEVCYGCHKLSMDSAVCESCRHKSPLRHVWIRTDYKTTAKQLIQLFKFERTQAVAPILAALTGESLPYLPENTLITHIPAATSRVRDRGYDQAKLLARYLAGSQGLPYVTVLARSGQARQVGSSRSVRLRQIEGVFRPVRGYLIKGAEVLLVDDVMTTGATLEEAARTLKKAGAKRVNAVVFAHKQ